MTGMSLSSLYYRLIRLSVRLIRDPRRLEGLSDSLSRIRHRFSKGSSALYKAHLRRIFPDATERRLDEILSGYWKMHERNLTGLFRLTEEEPSEALKRVSWSGRELLDLAEAEGRGALLLVPHYGDERGLHVIMGMAGYRVHVITSRYSDMSPYCRKSRLAPGEKYNEMHFPDENPRWMYRILEQGGIIHYGSTAYGGPSGTWTTAFGVPVLLPSAPWKLWKRTGCAVLGAYCTQTPGMGWEICFQKLDTPGNSRDFAGMTARAAEEAARRTPEQYEWKNLAIRHRETNTIVRTGSVPSEERLLEDASLPADSDPSIIHPEAACSGP